MESDTKVAVFGSTGLIGSAVCLRLKSEGYKVIAFARDIEKARLKVPGLTYARYRGFEEMARDLVGITHVINFSGSEIFGKNSSEIESSRVGLVKNIVSAFRKMPYPPQVFINGSASGFYGYERNDVDGFTEEMPAAKDYWGDLVSRWEAESLEAESLGTRVVNIRTSVVLSSRGRLWRELYPLFRKYLGGYPRPGNQWFSWIHIDDEVSIAVEALKNDSYRGPVNAASPNSVRMREFTKLFGDVLGRPSWLPIPAFVIRSRFGKSSDLILNGAKIIPMKLKGYGFTFKFPDLMPALQDIARRNI
ncbi:MAG: TIGR01777 family oxidoreductase [Candidatus Thermoplasmatota archaeon]|nr:TIGR01777 family oxidoreductase [Candidatus Thermoplasmatota archaeon]MCL5731073.1 TIGR01777 family oxidoreductase [Candidatus Thermoplasmatota archaeon]